MEKPVTIHAPGHPPPFREPSPLHRAVGASALGNAVEWFDYGIYAYGVTYISAALFPGDTEEAVLFALATFAISFLVRSEEHTSELQSLMRISYAVFCLKKKINTTSSQ